MTATIKSRKYIAIDGEGETRHVDGCAGGIGCECIHYYCLLAWRTTDGQSGYAYNPEGIPTIDAVEFLFKACQQHRAYVPVMFSASYDFNCILRHLDRKRAQWLWDEQPVRVGNLLVDYNHRTLTMRKGKKRVSISDVWRFYQGKFTTALEKNIPEYESLPAIRAGKDLRSQFDFAKQFDQILHYCNKELEALCLLLSKLDKDLTEAGVGRTQLNGAGSIAAKMMQQYHIKRYRPTPKQHDYRDLWPPEVEVAAYYAYSAGRIEPWKFGFWDGDFYVYDLRSAYPRAMLDLPQLVDGSWRRRQDADDGGSFALYKVRFDGRHNQRGFPFFQRIENGCILYPARVEGWYWSPEVAAARATGFDFEVLDGWEWIPNDPVKPFAFIQRLFDKRAALKALGMMGAQEIIKLGLNSLYGKLAQTVGGDALHPPPFHQIGWAGYVTARTRAEVFRIAMQQPNATVFIATDGIASVSPLDVPIGNGLGEWEATRYDGALVVQAGVYFLWDGDKCIHKYRGFDADAIQPDAIINAWKRGEEKTYIPSTRFITLGSALQSKWDRWCKWRTIPRELELTGGDGKRDYDRRRKDGEPWRTLVDLDPYSLPEITMSRAYTPDWKNLEDEKLDDVLLSTYEAELEAAIA